MSQDTEPAWKRNGRNGPFDWWLGCETHGSELRASCLSCLTAMHLNADFAKQLEKETQQKETSE